MSREPVPPVRPKRSPVPVDEESKSVMAAAMHGNNGHDKPLLTLVRPPEPESLDAIQREMDKAEGSIDACKVLTKLSRPEDRERWFVLVMRMIAEVPESRSKEREQRIEDARQCFPYKDATAIRSEIESQTREIARVRAVNTKPDHDFVAEVEQRKAAIREMAEIEDREYTLADLADAAERGELICVTGRSLRDLADLGVRALQRRNDDAAFLFLHGDVLVRVVKGRPTKIEQLHLDALRHEMERATKWFRLGSGNTLLPIPPPLDVCRDILATPNVPLPRLVGLRDLPYFDVDGVLVTQRGFHRQTGIFLDCPASLTVAVPERPSFKDARRAAMLFDQMLREFPFDGQRKPAQAVQTPSFANMAGAILTPIIREMLPDGAVTPLFAFDAPGAPGSGKTLLIKIICWIACGRNLPFSPPVESGEELRKSILAELLQGHPFVTIDNAGERIESRALASAMTAAVVSGRVLGFSRIAHVPNRATWLVSGNNLRFSGENLRRAVWIFLDPKMEHPEDRTGFALDLPRWVLANRSAIVSAALTMVKYWIAEGRPAWTGPAPGSFEEWAQMVGGILEAAGIERFLGNRDAFRDRSDAEGNEWRSFVLTWQERHGARIVGVAELVLDARELLPSVMAKAQGEHGASITLGKALAAAEGKIIAGHRLTLHRRGREAEKARKRDGWSLEPVS